MHRIKLENLLSFGPDAQELKLTPLNVLIGPTGSGKSSLIEMIDLLRAAPGDFMAPIRKRGGGSTSGTNHAAAQPGLSSFIAGVRKAGQHRTRAPAGEQPTQE